MSNQSQEFLIQIKTVLEDAGIKLTDQEFKKLGESVENSSKKLEEHGKKAHEAGLSHRELHEAAGAVARTMGGLPDIGLWISPQLVGLAVLTTAYEKISEHIVEVIKRQQELIEKSREVEERFRDALPKALAESRLEAEKFEQSLRKARAAIDDIATAQKQSQETAERTLKTETSLADAEERRATATIALAEGTRQLNHEQATLLELNSKHHTQEIKDAAADAAGIAAVETHRRAAVDYGTRGNSAQDTLDKTEPEQARIKTAIETQAGTLKDTQEALEQAKKELSEAETALAKEKIVHSVVGDLDAIKLSDKTDAVRAGSDTVRTAKENEEAATAHAQALERHKAALDAQVSAAREEILAAQQKAAAEHEAAELQEKKNAEEKAARDAVRTVGRQTDLIELAGKNPISAGAAGEGRAALLTDIPKAIQEGEQTLNDIAGAQSRGETVTGATMKRLLDLTERLIGYVANPQLPREYTARLSELETRMEQMDNRYSVQRLGN